MGLKRSIKLPITLAIVMIALIVVLIFGWVLVTVFGASTDQRSAAFYYTALPLGLTFLALVLIGVVIYLTLSIKAINLTQRQSNFIDSVTHELKSPIASLKLYLQTLALRPVSPQQQQQFWQDMLDDVERLDELINHVLQAGAVEREPRDDEAEPVRIDELIAGCAEEIVDRYRLAEDTISVDVPAAVIRAPRVDLVMIFRNLIDNAVKYAGDAPQIRVNLSGAENGRLALSVTDNGPGIPKKLRRKIFGRFVRLGSELERQQGGTGLGLYIVRTLVRRLRGKVRIADPKQGPGTVFEVHLPGQMISSPATSVDESPADISVGSTRSAL